MKTYLEQLIEEHQLDPEFITQYAVSDVIADIVETMTATGMSRAELAERAGLAPAQITRILKGDHNMTVKTLGKIAAALGKSLTIAMKTDLEAVGKTQHLPAAHKKKAVKRIRANSKPQQNLS